MIGDLNPVLPTPHPVCNVSLSCAAFHISLFDLAFQLFVILLEFILLGFSELLEYTFSPFTPNQEISAMISSRIFLSFYDSSNEINAKWTKHSK